MSTFRSIEELVKSLDREKELLKEMFAKRKSLSFRYDYALEMTEYKEERIRYLIDYGVIRDTGDFRNLKRRKKRFVEYYLLSLCWTYACVGIQPNMLVYLL